jgi:diguanylate cyclase (GGDEF)-like protein
MQKTAHILIIDDDPLNRVVLDNTLSEEYQISQCESAAQALTFLENNTVDLIILDIRMPSMSGYDLLERLKANQNTYAIPVIIISASNSYNDEAKGLQMGAMDYITKPFSPLIVKARVKNHLAIKQKNDLLEKLASIDGLTEIPNRRLLDDTLSQQYQMCAEQNKPLSLLLIEIDFFKEFNEHVGYAAGDECLVKVAHALDCAIQEYQGFVARYDGVRFAVILTGHNSESALKVAIHMHTVIDCLKIAHGSSPICAHLSISIGIVHITSDFFGNELQVFKLADSALHQAHQQQERVVVINK